MTTLRLLPDLEDALRRIPGIRAASVVTGPDAAPTEVHIVATAGKQPKQVVRDVQSLAMAQYGVEIDHRIVSVVAFDDGEGGGSAAGADDTVVLPDAGAAGEARTSLPRPAIAAITVRTTGAEAEAAVALRAGESTYEGTARGPSGTAGRPRLVARAAFEACAELLGLPGDVEQATVVAVGGRSVAVSVVLLAAPRTGEQLLTGSALVRGDEADAVARSVLDALNRHLTG